MTLQEKLNNFKRKFQQQVPAPVLEKMHNATEDLRNSGILEKISKKEKLLLIFRCTIL